MIDKVIVESDEGGFRLILDGDLGDEVENYMSGRVDARLNLSLSSTAALELREQVREQIEEWAATHDAVRADFERYKQVPPYVSENRPDWCPPTPGRQEGDASTSPSDLADRADYERKRDRENR